MTLEPYVSLFARAFVGMVLLIAGVTKLFGRPPLVEVVRSYQLLPESSVLWFSRLLPVWEIAVAIGLLTNILPRWAALSALFLFLIFGAAIAINLERGRYFISCGCFGPNKGQKLSWKLVARNGVLAGMALVALPILDSADGLLTLSRMESVPVLMTAATAIGCWWLTGIILKVWRLPNLLDGLKARSH